MLLQNVFISSSYFLKKLSLNTDFFLYFFLICVKYGVLLLEFLVKDIPDPLPQTIQVIVIAVDCPDGKIL